MGKHEVKALKEVKSSHRVKGINMKITAQCTPVVADSLQKKGGSDQFVVIGVSLRSSGVGLFFPRSFWDLRAFFAVSFFLCDLLNIRLRFAFGCMKENRPAKETWWSLCNDGFFMVRVIEWIIGLFLGNMVDLSPICLHLESCCWFVT